MAAHVVIFPSVGAGHITPFIAFARLLTSLHDLHVTLITTPLLSRAVDMHALLGALPISIASLPDTPDAADPAKTPSTPFLVSINRYMENLCAPMKTTLQSLHSARPISAFVTDLFCSAMVETAAALAIPAYLLFTSSAASAFLVLFQNHFDGGRRRFAQMTADDTLEVSALGRLPLSALPETYIDSGGPVTATFAEHARRFLRTAGVIVNTFQALEPRPLAALRAAKEMVAPPVYAVGPLLSLHGRAPPVGGNGDSGVLEWLERQPERSVLYICFGSECVLAAAQVAEMAAGLEASGRRFVWVLGNGVEVPAGFEERVGDRGLAVRGWAPQASVLRCPATGGFVSHCGWNSVLESVWMGVPIIAWPIRADQRTNAFFLVETGVAVGVRKGGNGVVGREEVGRVVRELFEGNVGRAVRERLRTCANDARTALFSAEGSSRTELASLVSTWNASSSS